MYNSLQEPDTAAGVLSVGRALVQHDPYREGYWIIDRIRWMEDYEYLNCWKCYQHAHVKVIST